MTTRRAAALAVVLTLVVIAAAAAPALGQGKLNLSCTANEEWCKVMASEFGKRTGVDVAYTRKGTGETYAQIKAEKASPKSDIWWGGTVDPHLQAAEEKLTARYESPMLKDLLPWARAQWDRSGGRAVGVSGKDGNLVLARKAARTRIDPATNTRVPVDLGFVGEPERVDADVLRMIMNSDLIPVVAPIGVDPRGQTYNINADTVAGAVAGAIAAERLILLTDVEGVLDREGKVVPHLKVAEARQMMADGTISGGMIPKIETAIDAVEKGVRAAVILDGRIPHVLLLELFTEHGAGTLIEA